MINFEDGAGLLWGPEERVLDTFSQAIEYARGGSALVSQPGLFTRLSADAIDRFKSNSLYAQIQRFSSS